jgi:hypothetical protein
VSEKKRRMTDPASSGESWALLAPALAPAPTVAWQVLGLDMSGGHGSRYERSERPTHQQVVSVRATPAPARAWAGPVSPRASADCRLPQQRNRRAGLRPSPGVEPEPLRGHASLACNVSLVAIRMPPVTRFGVRGVPVPPLSCYPPSLNPRGRPLAPVLLPLCLEVPRLAPALCGATRWCGSPLPPPVVPPPRWSPKRKIPNSKWESQTQKMKSKIEHKHQSFQNQDHQFEP